MASERILDLANKHEQRARAYPEQVSITEYPTRGIEYLQRKQARGNRAALDITQHSDVNMARVR